MKFYFPQIQLLLILSAFGFLSQSCDKEGSHPEKSAQKASQTYFQLLFGDQTGIDFNNQVEDQEKFNILTYRNFYNGGGVAVGDVNNDGLPDLYFTANLQSNKLYLNKGDFTFEDITEKTRTGGTKTWSTGATMADVNGDGWLDIYVSNSGDVEGGDKENELFINNGDLTFTEKAAEYGLNNRGYSTQASFFDYDLDGDLDCYLLNNSFKDPSKIELYKNMRNRPDELGGDKLYRNDGGKFTDVTLEAGIYSSEIGFGLGAAISDINHDYLPDIYISNDFWERDYLYINQGDGTFSEELIDRIDLCSIASMGGDIADINNDGHPEIISTDMLAGDNYRLQAMTAFDPYHLEDMKYRANYHYQVLQNCLHLNDGEGNFQEIGMLSGVAATDWSWGALVFDFENDGNKDLFVSNGITKDIMSMDFRDFLADNDVYRIVAQNGEADFKGFIEKMPSQPLKNYALHNKGNLQFENVVDQLGLGQPSFSNGATYGDLDNDGDYDLIINNVNMPAFIYRNESDQRMGNHYLKIKFEGYAENPFGVGTQVDLVAGGKAQTMQNFNSRGFQSCVEPSLIFGLGTAETVEEVNIIWPDRKVQTLTNIQADQTLTVKYSEAAGKADIQDQEGQTLFADVTSQVVPEGAVHKENRYNDFDHEPLLMRHLSTESPRIIKGDVNQDGREDFLLLGAKNDEDKLFIQQANGTFKRKTSMAFSISKGFESTCGAFFDHDGDGDLDIMLGAGGNEYQEGGKFLILRYFRNEGNGEFVIDNQRIPQIVGNFSTLEVADIDGDGDMDMFLGARCIPGNYGLPPRNFLFKNENGSWQDITPESIGGLGMVTDASWNDIDGDADPDLVVTGDWASIQVFRNNGGILGSAEVIPNSGGWWNRIEPADLDGDGDTDFVLGNWGTNTKLKASPQKPVTMHVNDFDRNGKSEFIISWYPPLENQSYPFATKQEITAQLPHLRKKILMYDDYAKSTYESLFTPEERQNAITWKATELRTSVLWNNGGSFTLKPLPVEAQVAPVFGIATGDFNQDGKTDIFLGGNFYNLKPQVGRHDASRGVLLAGTGNSGFQLLPHTDSGIFVKGEVRDAVAIQVGDQTLLLVARNNDELVVFREGKPAI